MRSIFLSAILFCSLYSSLAQNILDDYKDYETVTYASIAPKLMIQALKFDIDQEDPENEAYLEMIDSIEIYEGLLTTDATINSEIDTRLNRKSSKYKTLHSSIEDETNIDFYYTGKKNKRIKEILVKYAPIDNPESVSYAYVRGKLNLEELPRFFRSVKIPGAESLSKL